MSNAAGKGERIAKVLSRAGIASRRDAEKMIQAGRVTLNGKLLETPAVTVTAKDKITVDGKPLSAQEPARLWLYHKPKGLITSHHDEKGRATVFDHLPPTLPRVMSVGRLDLNSEGLLLLTNDGALARQLELPATGLARTYRVRALGKIEQKKLDRLKSGIRVAGISYGPIMAELEQSTGANIWVRVTLHEGKNREIRRVFEYLGLQVNRLIRISYGPFELGALEPGMVKEVPAKTLQLLLPKAKS